jgi:hypothetical protein
MSRPLVETCSKVRFGELRVGDVIWSASERGWRIVFEVKCQEDGWVKILCGPERWELASHEDHNWFFYRLCTFEHLKLPK